MRNPPGADRNLHEAGSFVHIMLPPLINSRAGFQDENGTVDGVGASQSKIDNYFARGK
jgi:hypothetical protein